MGSAAIGAGQAPIGQWPVCSFFAIYVQASVFQTEPLPDNAESFRIASVI